MTEPPDDPRPTGAWPWGERTENPRTYPVRSAGAVADAIARSARQDRDLEATMAATGQAGALVVAPLDAVSLGLGNACTSTTWSEGRITVLPYADVVVLFELPATIDGQPSTTWVRWDVVARVCGTTCWSRVPDLDPPRVITRRWPDPDQLEVVRGLSLTPPA